VLHVLPSDFLICLYALYSLLAKLFDFFHLCSQHVSVITALHIFNFIWQFHEIYFWELLTLHFILVVCVCVYVCVRDRESLSLVLFYGLHDNCWNWMFLCWYGVSTSHLCILIIYAINQSRVDTNIV
jgi:hypothetical protein